MSIVEMRKVKFEQKTEAYEVKIHPQSNRLYHIDISTNVIVNFLATVKIIINLFSIWNIRHMSAILSLLIC